MEDVMDGCRRVVFFFLLIFVKIMIIWYEIVDSLFKIGVKIVFIFVKEIKIINNFLILEV